MRILILASLNLDHGNANECKEDWLQRTTYFHFGTTFTGEVGLS